VYTNIVQKEKKSEKYDIKVYSYIIPYGKLWKSENKYTKTNIE